MKIIPVRALKDNYIWLVINKNKVWAIDPGEAEPVIQYLKEHQLNLAGILLTHHHADHSGGIADLLDVSSNISVYGSHLSSIKTVSNHVKENSTIQCDDLVLQAIEIPGHTLDHTAYYGNDILFSGDTLFSAGCGRVFEGTMPMMYQSLQKLSQLPPTTKIYCGHEYTLANLNFAQAVEPNNIFIQQKISALQSAACTLPSILSEEKLMNPFLRCEESDVIKAVENQAGKKLNSPAEVFHYLREWKNNFR